MLKHMPLGVQLEEEDDFDKFVNRDSWQEAAAVGDPNIRCLQAGDVLQLERKGFYKVDAALVRPGAEQAVVLLSIPDGHSKGKKG